MEITSLFITEADGSNQTLTSSSSFMAVAATLADGSSVNLFPIAVVTTPVSDPIVEVDLITESGVETAFVPKA